MITVFGPFASSWSLFRVSLVAADQRTRAFILESLDELGGANKTELCQRVGIGWGNIGHHLYVLERAGLVTLDRRGKETWAFRPDVPEDVRICLVALRGDRRTALVEGLKRRDLATIGELSEDLALSRKVIRTHLQHLVHARVVDRQPGYPPRFSLSSAVSWLLGRRGE